jgi:uncharacterized SAM-binding protein YcdF (DUF218 family)
MVLAVLVLAVSAGWLARVQILQGAARAWIVSDSIVPADAVAVLGGGLETRPFAAADLYKRGMVRQILISAVKPGPAEKLEIVPSHVELNRATLRVLDGYGLRGKWPARPTLAPCTRFLSIVLLKLGVPPEAILSFGTDVSSTYEEAGALAEWARTNGVRSVIVPTEIFSSRRVRWILDKQLGSVGTRTEVQALPPLEYDADNWWQHEAGVIGFQNEVVKYFYYRLKY